MSIQSRDPIQQAADEAGGCEGLRLKHNLKEGVIYLGGAVAPSDLKVCLWLSEACHGWLQFDGAQALVASDIRRYADVAPDRDERRPDWSPNTSCLGVIMPGGQEIVTYSGASWGVSNAFKATLLKPFARMQQTMFPIVALGFEPQKDDYGNYRPTFAVIAWKPRSDFGAALGEGPQSTPPQLPPATAEPAKLTSTRNFSVVTSGLEQLRAAKLPSDSEVGPAPAPPPEPYDGPDGDEIPF